MKKERFCHFIKIWWANIKPLFLLNMVYSLMSMALLPSGLASVGMANVAGNLARERYYFSFREYWDAIRKCWKQALCAGLINLLFTAVLALVIFSFMKYYLWPRVILFRMPLISTYENSFIFAFLNLKSNLFIGLVSLLCYVLAAVMLLHVPYLVFPFLKRYMIDAYYAEHPGKNRVWY